MKTLLTSLSLLAFGSYNLFTSVEESFEQYKLDSVCIQQHIAKGYERRNITDKQCPNNSLVKQSK